MWYMGYFYDTGGAEPPPADEPQAEAPARTQRIADDSAALARRLKELEEEKRAWQMK